MIGILFGIATGVMFAFIINEERLRARNSRALYLVRTDKPVTKDQWLETLATELTYRLRAKFVATHGCIICQSHKMLLTLSEAIAYRQEVRETVFA